MVIEQFLRKLCEIRATGHGGCIVMGIQSYGYSIQHLGPGRGFQLKLDNLDYGCTLNQLIHDVLNQVRPEDFEDYSTEQIVCCKDNKIHEVSDVTLANNIINIIVDTQ